MENVGPDSINKTYVTVKLIHETTHCWGLGQAPLALKLGGALAPGPCSYSTSTDMHAC